MVGRAGVQGRPDLLSTAVLRRRVYTGSPSPLSLITRVRPGAEQTIDRMDRVAVNVERQIGMQADGAGETRDSAARVPRSPKAIFAPSVVREDPRDTDHRLSRPQHADRTRAEGARPTVLPLGRPVRAQAPPQQVVVDVLQARVALVTASRTCRPTGIDSAAAHPNGDLAVAVATMPAATPRPASVRSRSVLWWCATRPTRWRRGAKNTATPDRELEVGSVEFLGKCNVRAPACSPTAASECGIQRRPGSTLGTASRFHHAEQRPPQHQR